MWMDGKNGGENVPQYIEGHWPKEKGISPDYFFSENHSTDPHGSNTDCHSVCKDHFVELKQLVIYSGKDKWGNE